MAVIALDDEEIDAVDATRLDACSQHAGRCRQLHAKRLVEDNALETFDGRLENVRARRAAERQGNFAAFDANRDLVLRAGERQAYALIAREQRALRQFPKDAGKFPVGELAIVVVFFPQRAAGGDESDRARAFAADPLQHRVVVARADAEIAGDDLALPLLWQDAAEETPTFLALEGFRLQRQRLGQRHG